MAMAVAEMLEVRSAPQPVSVAQIRKLTKRYGAVVALRGCGFRYSCCLMACVSSPTASAYHLSQLALSTIGVTRDAGAAWGHKRDEGKTYG